MIKKRLTKRLLDKLFMGEFISQGHGAFLKKGKRNFYSITQDDKDIEKLIKYFGVKKTTKKLDQVLGNKKYIRKNIEECAEKMYVTK